MKAIVFHDSLVMHEVSINEILITLKKRLRIHRCAIGDTSPFAFVPLSHGFRHIHTHFWQVHLFEFQYKRITEKWFLPFISDQGKNITLFLA